MNIKNRMLLFLLPAIIISLLALTLFFYHSTYNAAINHAEAEAKCIAIEQSQIMTETLKSPDMALASLAHAISQDKAAGRADRKNINIMVKGLASAMPDASGAWALFEPNAFDGKDSEFVNNADFGNKEGRANAYWVRKDETLAYNVSDDYDTQNYYVLPKSRKSLSIIPPYVDNIILMTSVAMPIMEDGKFIGVVGMDIELGYLSQAISSIKPYETGYAMLITDKETVVASPVAKDAGKAMEEVLGKDLAGKIAQSMEGGKIFSIEGSSLLDKSENVSMFFVPVRASSFEKPWYFMVAMPTKKFLAQSSKQLYTLLAVNGVVLVVLLLCVFVVAGGVSRPLQRLCQYAQAVANGNYSTSVDSKGFVKELVDLRSSLVSMVDALLVAMREAQAKHEEANKEAEQAHQCMLDSEAAKTASERGHKDLLEAADKVGHVSRSLQETSAVLDKQIGLASRENKAQNDLMDKTVCVIKEMSASTEEVTKTADDTREFATRTRSIAEEGARVVNGTIEAFENIRDRTTHIGLQMTELSEKTEGIASILEIINDIADQTNLLALNAAIEAARAGESGRGFAVVADEVRKLAEKTMQATKEVDEAIVGMRRSMEESAHSVNGAVETANKTVEMGHEARKSLSDIVSLVQGMNEQINNIAALCQKQVGSSQEATEIVDKLRQLCVAVTAAMEQSSITIQELEPDSRSLVELLRKCRHSF